MRSVCIKMLNGRVERLKKDKAETLVDKGKATYCSKQEWKECR